MAWSELSGETATVTIKTDGDVQWNDAAQVALGAPEAVNLFHDAGGGRLGLRRINPQGANGLRVSLESGNFVIAAQQHLDDAGIDYSVQFSAELQEPTPPTPPDDMGDSAIYWISLP